MRTVMVVLLWAPRAREVARCELPLRGPLNLARAGDGHWACAASARVHHAGEGLRGRDRGQSLAAPHGTLTSAGAGAHVAPHEAMSWRSVYHTASTRSTQGPQSRAGRPDHSGATAAAVRT